MVSFASMLPTLLVRTKLWMEKSVGDHAVRHTSSQVMTFLIGWKKAESATRDNKKNKETDWAYFEARGPLIDGSERSFGR